MWTFAFWRTATCHFFHWNQSHVRWFTIDTKSLAWPFLLPANGYSLNPKWQGRRRRCGGVCVLGGGRGVEITAVKEGSDCIGAACERQQRAQPNQSGRSKKVLLSARNDPLDNHTGTERLYLTLIAKTAAPPSENGMTPERSPCHPPAERPDLFPNGIHNHPSSVFTLIVILRLALLYLELQQRLITVYCQHIHLCSTSSVWPSWHLGPHVRQQQVACPSWGHRSPTSPVWGSRLCGTVQTKVTVKNRCHSKRIQP